jgi:ADP-ribose pyrophosphatase YjhB (NUDIX family)
MTLEPTGLRNSKPTDLRVSVNAFIVHDGKILLQRRSDNGNWNLPGGGVKIGESLTVALRREVWEETGLTVHITRYIGVYSDPLETTLVYPDGRVLHYIAHALECRVTGGTLQSDHESLELGWFDPRELPEPFSPQHRRRVADALEGKATVFQ